MKRWVCLLALAIPLAAVAEGKGVDWEGQVLKATGSGAPDMKATNPAQARLGAERAAQMDAFRNLLAQAKGIRITADRTVGDEMAKDEIRGKVEGIIRGYKITAKRYFSDSGVEIDVEVPLGALTDAFAPTAADTKLAVNAKGTVTNTGLVVDASGLKVDPALSPRLLDENGNALYGVEVLTPEARRTQGVVAYVDRLEEGRKHALVGDKPLVVKAQAAKGTDLVISFEDAKKLTSANNAFLAEGRVVIVAGQGERK